MRESGYRLIVVFGVVALAGALPARADDRPRTIADVLGALQVVSGKVVAVAPRPDLSDENGRGAQATVEVTRVYCGDGVHVGDTFWVIAVEGNPAVVSDTRSLQLPREIPKVGQSGIWQIHRTGNGQGFRGNHDFHDDFEWRPLKPSSGFFLPFLGYEGDRSNEEGGEKVATMLWSLAEGADEAARIKALADYGRNDNPYVAVTACWILNQIDADGGRAAVARSLFLDGAVPPAARAALDELLCRWRLPDWTSSKDRHEGFTRLVRDAKMADDFAVIGERLRDGIESGYFTMDQCLDIARAAMRNDRFVPERPNRVGTFFDFSIAPHSAAERDAAFGFFQNLIETSRDDHLRQAAAFALANVGFRKFPLTHGELVAVRALRDGAQDAETIRLLNLALERAAMKKMPATLPG